MTGSVHVGPFPVPLPLPYFSLPLLWALVTLYGPGLGSVTPGQPPWLTRLMLS